jgi:hypothetical protein
LYIQDENFRNVKNESLQLEVAILDYIKSLRHTTLSGTPGGGIDRFLGGGD